MCKNKFKKKYLKNGIFFSWCEFYLINFSFRRIIRNTRSIMALPIIRPVTLSRNMKLVTVALSKVSRIYCAFKNIKYIWKWHFYLYNCFRVAQARFNYGANQRRASSAYTRCQFKNYLTYFYVYYAKAYIRAMVNVIITHILLVEKWINASAATTTAVCLLFFYAMRWWHSYAHVNCV